MARILRFLIKFPEENCSLRMSVNNKQFMSVFTESTHRTRKKPGSRTPIFTHKDVTNEHAMLPTCNVFKRWFMPSLIHGKEQDVTVPPFPESVAEGDVRWNKNVGDSVVTDEVVCEIETDKTTIPVTAPGNGIIVERYVEEGGTIRAQSKIFRINLVEGVSPKQRAKADPSPMKVMPVSPPKELPLPASKAVSPSPVGPSTPTPATEKTSPGHQEPKSPMSSDVVIKVPTQDSTREIGGTRSETRVKMNRMRQRIAQRLKDAQNECAMLTTFNEIDMATIMSFRKEHQEAFTKKHGIKLGFMSAFVKASSYALQDQPIVNAVIEENDIIYRDYIDISIAVASPKGLVVPVLRNVTSMSFADIERSIFMFGEKAKAGKLSVEDMDGGTFTISNGGVFGSLMGTPIINPPQSAILGMHATFERPVAIKGQVVIKPMMYVALTYDHRLIDGREAVLFLRKIKNCIENPISMLAGL